MPKTPSENHGMEGRSGKLPGGEVGEIYRDLLPEASETPRSSDCAPDPCEEEFLLTTASDSTARARSQVIGDELRAGEGRTLEEQGQEVFQYQIKTLTGLQYDQAKQISKFVKAQVWIVNIFVLVYVAVRVLKGEWPSDKLLLGWFASVVVEVIGLYIIVLKGIFDAANFGSHLSGDMRGKG